jgi:TatA/E family protein of Tat protein translocase
MAGEGAISRSSGTLLACVGMGSLSFSEIMVIVLVILVVFGPQRLPDLSRRAGELIKKAREAASSLSDTVGIDLEATIEPIRDAKQDFDGIRKDLTTAVTSIGVPDPKIPRDSKKSSDPRIPPDPEIPRQEVSPVVDEPSPDDGTEPA